MSGNRTHDTVNIIITSDATNCCTTGGCICKTPVIYIPLSRLCMTKHSHVAASAHSHTTTTTTTTIHHLPPSLPCSSVLSPLPPPLIRQHPLPPLPCPSTLQQEVPLAPNGVNATQAQMTTVIWAVVKFFLFFSSFNQTK